MDHMDTHLSSIHAEAVHLSCSNVSTLLISSAAVSLRGPMFAFPGEKMRPALRVAGGLCHVIESWQVKGRVYVDGEDRDPQIWRGSRP